MQKKILIAIDDSTSSRQTVEYAGRMQGLLRDLVFTLLHIQPAISQFLLDEARRSGKVQVELNRVAARNAEAAKALLAKYKNLLVRAGAAESAVEVLTLPRHLGVAKDILDQAQQGLFDAILVGRRGISSLQQMFMGSVSAHLIENSQVIPVWLVDGHVDSMRIMAAVDGSESALRAVEHLGFVLSGNPQAKAIFPCGPTAQGLLRDRFQPGGGGGF